MRLYALGTDAVRTRRFPRSKGTRSVQKRQPVTNTRVQKGMKRSRRLRELSDIRGIISPIVKSHPFAHEVPCHDA
jgi:hypothetical protein